MLENELSGRASVETPAIWRAGVTTSRPRTRKDATHTEGVETGVKNRLHRIQTSVTLTATEYERIKSILGFQ